MWYGTHDVEAQSTAVWTTTSSEIEQNGPEKVYMLGAQIFVVYGTITNENVYFSSVSVILQESTRMPVR